MHSWGDEWFESNGNDLHQAINYCMTTWRKWGRIGSHGKEKYGTFRHHTYFYSAEWPIHELLRPGYVYYRGPRWLMYLEVKLGKLVKLTKLHKLVRLYQYMVYNYTIQRACKLYPNIIDELVSDAARPELIKPGLFGSVDGQVIHNKYWTRY